MGFYTQKAHQLFHFLHILCFRRQFFYPFVKALYPVCMVFICDQVLIKCYGILGLNRMRISSVSSFLNPVYGHPACAGIL